MSGETNPNRIRDDEIYVKRMRGAKLQQLAEEYDLSDAWISEIVRKVARSLPERDRSELLALSVEWLEDLREKVMDLYSLPPAPVTSGNMGLILQDPETGETVRDYSLRRSALQMAHDLNKTFAKRLGLDAPAETAVKATVHYTIEGIDPEDLT